MRKKRFAILLVIPILLSLAFLFWYASDNDAYRVKSEENEQVNLNEEETAWVKENPTTSLKVDPKLSYLTESGFLSVYCNSLVEKSGMELIVDSESKGALGEVVVITHINREEQSKNLLTKPIFQINGRLYKRVNLHEKDSYSAVAIKGDFTEAEKGKLAYNGKPVEIREAPGAPEAVAMAEESKADFILGDRNLIDSMLLSTGMEKTYEDGGHQIFEHNVCIVIPTQYQELYSIMNDAIIQSQKDVLLENAKLQTGEKAIVTSVENRHSYSVALLIITFLTVFGGFFIYYLTTRNLYDELTVRMTQLTESKNEMQTTFNGVSSFMAELDQQGKILNMNRFMRESLEVIDSDVIGKDICEVMGIEGLDRDTVRHAISSMTEGKDVETCSAGKGSMIFDIQIYPIKNQKLEVEKLLFMGADVTEVKIAQRQMLQQNKMIAVGQLAAGIAHEIRNPLGLIRNYCYVLKNIEDEEKRNQAVLMIEKAVETSGEIITSLLNFSRVSEGRVENFPIISHIKSVILINEGMLKKEHIEISVESSQEYHVRTRKESFDMIFINLLSNAVDAISDRGSILVKVWDEKEVLCMEVRDTGSGISKEVLGDIFNPFFTTKGSTHGNGLGLYIVYNEVEKMNGSIQVDSRQGEGTTFRICLPILEKEER